MTGRDSHDAVDGCDTSPRVPGLVLAALEMFLIFTFTRQIS